MYLILLFASVASALVVPDIQKSLESLTGKALIDYLNSNQKSFNVKPSKFSPEAMQKKAMKKEYTKPKQDENDMTTYSEEIPITRDVPDSFDARDKWSYCPTIGRIYDQGACGSCWAFATATSMTDRLCITSNSTFVFSPEDILSCCPDCGSGCAGGDIGKALKYIKNTGVCSGGPYQTTATCKPYKIYPCSDDCPPEEPPTPKCENSCQQEYSTPYEKDRRFATETYTLPDSENAVKYEIMTNGPVATCFGLYEDLYHYKSGIYKHVAGKHIGGHCVKVLGWGADNGVKYWLAANQWNTTFGEDGFFRVLIGDNNVNFDSSMMTGHPEA